MILEVWREYHGRGGRPSREASVVCGGRFSQEEIHAKYSRIDAAHRLERMFDRRTVDRHMAWGESDPQFEAAESVDLVKAV